MGLILLLLLRRRRRLRLVVVPLDAAAATTTSNMRGVHSVVHQDHGHRHGLPLPLLQRAAAGFLILLLLMGCASTVTGQL